MCLKKMLSLPSHGKGKLMALFENGLQLTDFDGGAKVSNHA